MHPLEFTQRELPRVCAATGEHAGWYARMSVSRPAHPASFLLLFLGPLGWLLLFVVLTRSDGTEVDIPVSRQVMDNIKEKRRRWRWFLATLVATVGAFSLIGRTEFYAVSWIVLLPFAAVGIWVSQVKTHRIGLRLDGVGLVTVKNVHPNFVAAVGQWRQNAPAATHRP